MAKTFSLRGLAAAAATALLLGACGGGDSTDALPSEHAQALGSQGPAAIAGNVSLAGASTLVSLTSDNEWSLSKTGSLSGNTVT